MDLLKHDVQRSHPRMCIEEKIYTQIILSLSMIFSQQCRYHMEAAMPSSARIF
jgi:hypothetical protein